jgi:hypothetical protein
MVAGPPAKKRVKLGHKSKLSEAQIQDPEVFTDAGIPEIIADILLEWRRRALESLSVLEPSEARSALEKIVDHVMMPKPHIP